MNVKYCAAGVGEVYETKWEAGFGIKLEDLKVDFRVKKGVIVTEEGCEDGCKAFTVFDR